MYQEDTSNMQNITGLNDTFRVQSTDNANQEEVSDGEDTETEDVPSST